MSPERFGQFGAPRAATIGRALAARLPVTLLCLLLGWLVFAVAWAVAPLLAGCATAR